MAMFGLKKSKPSEGSELVLAYLEDAQRVRATIFAVDPKGREIPASLVVVTEERVTLGVQGRVMAEKGEPIGLLFYLDGLRLKATGRLQELKTGTLVMELPTAIALAERRKKPRARLNQREGATAIALTGLFEGIGLTGTIDNISEGGMCLKVGRAMNVKTQGPMHMGPNLLSKGEVFMVIKLSKLPKCPLIEVGGVAAHVASEGNGLSVGISFESDKESILGPVKAMVTSRAGSLPTSVPPKVRRQQPKAEPGEPAIELAAPRPVQKKEPDPPPATPPPAVAPDPLAMAPASTPIPEAAPAQPDAANRGSALNRMKKRTRGVLLAMSEGPDREALVGFLAADGYGKIRVAATLTELLDQLDEAQLVFVDGGVVELQGLALASLLRQRLDGEGIPVLLAEASVDAELVLGAQEVGVAQVLVKPYGLDAEFLQMIEGHLGIS
ncbi:MAG: response regulator [Geothrix sp.]|uniref:response regulator n=1 Tax=Geothrix sp. TaxID=1962974 RepID=UPI00185C63D3|nr:response regulator [Geothrix sp.]NWJ41723.1 response regulator [Geothrix sp.]WIL20297.1 MAG: response regulator [Geothrix sp.]